MTVFKKIVIALVVLVVAVGGLTAVLGVNELVMAESRQDGVNLSALDTGESAAVPLSWQGTATIWFLAGLQTPPRPCRRSILKATKRAQRRRRHI